MAKYSYEFKKKVVQEYLDGKGGYAYIAKPNGIPAESLLRRWVNAYKKFGDEGLLVRGKIRITLFNLNFLW